MLEFPIHSPLLVGLVLGIAGAVLGETRGVEGRTHTHHRVLAGEQIRTPNAKDMISLLSHILRDTWEWAEIQNPSLTDSDWAQTHSGVPPALTKQEAAP